jgi:molybdopterin-guanine dinucleotide biosynthesis protein B
MHEHRGDPEPTVAELVRHMSPVDLLIVEGFKREGHAKIEVFRRSVGKPLLAGHDRQVVAVASDGPVPETDRPVLDLNDVAAIADFVEAHCGLKPPEDARSWRS